MREADALQTALEYIQQNRYADSSAYLTSIVASLGVGGNHRKIDLSRFPLLNDKGRLIAFDLITAKVKNTYPRESWERMANKMLETIGGR